MRGYQKRVVCLKNTGSELFDEAYFVLKDGQMMASGRDCDLVREASRIIEENSGIGRKRVKISAIPRGVLIFAAGFISAATILILVMLLT